MSHYPKALLPVDHVEQVARRIRATIGPHAVLDTLRALYLWEWPYYPQYYIPAADVDPALIVEEDGTHRLKRGTVARLGISAGNVRRDRVAHRYLESTVAEIVGAVRFDWNALDAWYEEDEQVFVHPRNPYVRVDVLRSTRHVRVELDGVTLAESRAPVRVFETELRPAGTRSKRRGLLAPGAQRPAHAVPLQGRDERVLFGSHGRAAAPRSRLVL